MGFGKTPESNDRLANSAGALSIALPESNRIRAQWNGFTPEENWSGSRAARTVARTFYFSADFRPKKTVIFSLMPSSGPRRRSSLCSQEGSSHTNNYVAGLRKEDRLRKIWMDTMLLIKRALAWR
jgi:hypothetical protein